MGMLLDFSKHIHPERYAKASNSFEQEVLDFVEKWYSQKEFSLETSGSTGTPKKTTHSKEAMIQSALLTGRYFQFTEGKTTLLCLPITKIGGMMQLVRAIIWKLKLYVLPPKINLNLTALPSLDFAALLPAQAVSSFDQLASIRTILLGGAPLTSSLEEKIRTHTSSFYLSYGMTETISHIALKKLNGNDALPYFTTLPNISIEVDNNSCLSITAPELNISKLQTRDIIKLISPTSFDFIGRLDNIINSGGLKINAETVEKQISPFINSSFYVKGTPDPVLGEQVTLFIEGNIWSKEKVNKFKNQLQDNISKHLVPREIIFKEKFQHTTTGKILKND